jgi:hypothetical protein
MFLKIVLYTTLSVVKTFFTIRCPWKQIQVIFVVLGLLCDCRPVPQIILPLGGKKFPLGGVFAALLQC